MKKIIISILISILIIAGPSSFANASSISLLPTSPFYFLKEIERSIETFFTFDKAEKAELQLEIAQEKLSEIEILKNSNINYEEFIDGYYDSLEKLNNQLNGLEENNYDIQIFQTSLDELGVLEDEIFEDDPFLNEINGLSEDGIMQKLNQEAQKLGISPQEIIEGIGDISETDKEAIKNYAFEILKGNKTFEDIASDYSGLNLSEETRNIIDMFIQRAQENQ